MVLKLPIRIIVLIKIKNNTSKNDQANTFSSKGYNSKRVQEILFT